MTNMIRRVNNDCEDFDCKIVKMYESLLEKNISNRFFIEKSTKL